MSDNSRAPSAGSGGCAGILKCYGTRDSPPSRHRLDDSASRDIVGTMSKILNLFAAMCFLASGVLVAQPRTILDLRLGDDAALWQARSCVGEVGWNAPDEACVAMTWIHAKRARLTGVSLSTMVRAYSAAVRQSVPRRRSTPVVSAVPLAADDARGALRSSRTQNRRRWVQGLTLTGAAPAAWPEGLRRSWPRYQRRFREIHWLVERVLSGRVEDPCPNSTFYGGPMDSPPRGHEEDPECSFDGTAQLFYRPSYEGS